MSKDNSTADDAWVTDIRTTADDFGSIETQLDEGPVFGTDFLPFPVIGSYYPTRLEYFAGKALQGLVTGQSEKSLRTVAQKALVLAQEMEDAIDAAVE